MRETFVATTTALLEEDPRTAVVLADITAADFAPAKRRHPDRVLNVGIREQLMAGVAGGLALTGMRPYVHSYAPFVIDRAYRADQAGPRAPGRRSGAGQHRRVIRRLERRIHPPLTG
jgi:transketolase C-terminal domain/subunit